MSRTSPALAALLVLAPACAEDSSFVLRWNVGRTEDDAKVALTSVRQCSDLGLSRVKVLTLSADGTTEDQREFPCFPDQFTDPGGAAPGPELGAGTYYVTILGLTRRGIPRDDPSVADEDEVLARDQQTVVVHERGEGVVVDGFRLIGIDECHDGIDNDRDGAIDQADTPCRLGQTAEDRDIAGALFTFEATLLGGNERATCAGLGIGSFRITLDEDPTNTREIACTLVAQSFNATLAPGTHTWQVEAIAPGGKPLSAPLVGEEFVVPDEDFVLIPIDVDFSLDTFLAEPAFARPQRFSLEFQPYPDAPVNRQCQPRDGTLWIHTVQLTLQGATADEPEKFEDVELMDPITIPSLEDAALPLLGQCYDFEQIRVTSEIPWSAAGYAHYRLIAEAFPVGSDVACFSNEDSPALLAPGVDLALTIPRVRTDGVCSDCPKDYACDNCVDGVCLP